MIALFPYRSVILRQVHAKEAKAFGASNSIHTHIYTNFSSKSIEKGSQLTDIFIHTQAEKEMVRRLLILVFLLRIKNE